MGGRYVGIDLHRRRSVIYTMDADGEKLDSVRIANDPLRLLEEVARAGDDAEVVIEATYGWYWAVDVLQDNGFSVHLAHPAGNDWGKRRVKNDERDARDLRICCVSGGSRKHGSHPDRCGSCASWCAIGRSWCGCAPASKPKYTR